MDKSQKLIQTSVSDASLNQDELDDDDLIKDSAHQLKKGLTKKEKGLPLYTFNELPSYLQDNQYILTGYRANYTIKQVWHSAFAFHNETGNIWTHGVSFFAFIALSVYTGTIQWHPLESAIDKAILTIFTLSASLTFLSSSLFHLHICHSQKLYSIFVCLDYTGISALIAGSSIALIYFLFYCQTVSRIVWCSLIVLFNVVGVMGTMFRGFTGPRYRTARTFIFIISSVLVILPVIHFVSIQGRDRFPDLNSNFAGTGFLLMVFFYLLGVCIFIFKVPERFYPDMAYFGFIRGNFALSRIDKSYEMDITSCHLS